MEESADVGIDGAVAAFEDGGRGQAIILNRGTAENRHCRNRIAGAEKMSPGKNRDLSPRESVRYHGYADGVGGEQL